MSKSTKHCKRIQLPGENYITDSSKAKFFQPEHFQYEFALHFVHILKSHCLGISLTKHILKSTDALKLVYILSILKVCFNHESSCFQLFLKHPPSAINILIFLLDVSLRVLKNFAEYCILKVSHKLFCMNLSILGQNIAT